MAKSLTHLAITYNHYLTDATAECIGVNLGNSLHTLVLANCSRFSAGGLASMISKCPNLQLANLSHCASFPAGSLISLRKSLPKCTFIFDR